MQKDDKILDDKQMINLTEKAKQIRKNALIGIYNAKSGHPGGSLSCADIMAYLYFCEMNLAENPQDNTRDRFVLSKGHAAPALYAALALKGYFNVNELANLRKIGHMLQGHPDMIKVPGVDMSTGSLGQGISAAVGMATSFKADNLPNRTYCITGDGELQEGQVWEAAMFAAHNNLANLTVIIDNNGLQIDGKLSDVNSPEPIDAKFIAFGWDCIIVDGHDFKDLERGFNYAKQSSKPTVIIAKTAKGKGVSFMEDNPNWHGVAPNEEEFKKAMSELDI